jgi:hypothetical protein
MSFLEAVWYLGDTGCIIRPTDTFSGNARMYKFTASLGEAPPMLLSPKGLISMAEFLKADDTFERASHHADAV